MDVSIIIVNYNTLELTLQCIESVFKQTKDVDFEVILIDNASSDGSSDAIKRLSPQTIVIECNENLGFSRANNLGAEKAQGKYLLFLNSDTILLNNSIHVLFLFNEINSTKFKIGISGGILIDENRLETGSFGPLPSKILVLKSILGLLPRFTKMSPKETMYFHTNGHLEVGYVTGADMFISKSIFKDIGGFDANIFMYYEETDLQLRLKNANYHNFVINGTQIIHLEGASLSQVNFNNKKRLIVTKSMFYHFRKHSNYINFVIFKLFFLTIRLSTLFHCNYSWSEKKEYLLHIIKS